MELWHCTRANLEFYSHKCGLKRLQSEATTCLPHWRHTSYKCWAFSCALKCTVQKSVENHNNIKNTHKYKLNPHTYSTLVGTWVAPVACSPGPISGHVRQQTTTCPGSRAAQTAPWPPPSHSTWGQIVHQLIGWCLRAKQRQQFWYGAQLKVGSGVVARFWNNYRVVASATLKIHCQINKTFKQFYLYECN